MTLAKKLAALEAKAAAYTATARRPVALTVDGMTDANTRNAVADFIDRHGTRPLVLRLTTWGDYPDRERVVLDDEFFRAPDPRTPADHFRVMMEDGASAMEERAMTAQQRGYINPG